MGTRRIAIIIGWTLAACTPRAAPRAGVTPKPAARSEPARPQRQLTALRRAGHGNGDRDGDGILDRCDKCPDQPELYNNTLDADGCPERTTVKSSWHPFLRFVYFREGAAAIQPHQRAVIGWAAQALLRGDSFALACVGAIAPNEKGGFALAQRRAKSACQAIAQHGVAAARLQTHAVKNGVFRAGASAPSSRAWARRALLITVKRKPLSWYQKPWRTMRFDGAYMVDVDDKPATRPSGPARCPPKKAR